MLQDTSNKSPALLSGQPINHYGQTEYFQNKGAEVVANLGSSHKLQLKLASEKGASSWLTALGPTEEKAVQRCFYFFATSLSFVGRRSLHRPKRRPFRRVPRDRLLLA